MVNNKVFLLIGGLSDIGLHLIDHLSIISNYEIHVLDEHDSVKEKHLYDILLGNTNRVTIHYGSIYDESMVNKIINSICPNQVFFLIKKESDKSIEYLYTRMIPSIIRLVHTCKFIRQTSKIIIPLETRVISGQSMMSVFDSIQLSIYLLIKQLRKECDIKIVVPFIPEYISIYSSKDNQIISLMNGILNFMYTGQEYVYSNLSETMHLSSTSEVASQLLIEHRDKSIDDYIIESCGMLTKDFIKYFIESLTKQESVMLDSESKILTFQINKRNVVTIFFELKDSMLIKSDNIPHISAYNTLSITSGFLDEILNHRKNLYIKKHEKSGSYRLKKI